MAGQAFQVTDALKDKKQQQDFSYSSALKTPIFTKRDRAQLILIFSAVIKVKGKPIQYIKRNLSHIDHLIVLGASLEGLTNRQYKKLLVVAEIFRQQL
ncbi:hypothetical protein, partial [Fischerella sp. FACHB-380]|uniref:hypothetical protein n=1 Tax=Fischerella sp. FACHB-380 TaxID=2692799 RepID=UPI00168A3853